MSKLKKIVKSIYSCLYILFKYGPVSLKRKFDNYKYHNSITQQMIDAAHIYSEDVLDKQRKTRFKNPIQISILTPLFNTPEDFLLDMMNSLKKQTYSNWQLCLADASDDDHSYVQDICKKYCDEDSRFVYKKLDTNKGISGNTNDCFKLATGDYIGLLDHDDILHESLLYEVAKAINEENADFIFTDEVKFEGNIHNITDVKAFNFKPGFGVDDLRSHNFICHFTCYKKSLLESEPALYRDEFNGSQDHDMVLRLTEKAKRIVHISKPLYYWRLHQQSVSMDLNSKPYVVDAAIRAVSAQLDRMNEKGTVQSSLPFLTIYKVDYPLESKPLITMLVNCDSEKALDVFKSKVISKSSYKNLEFIKMESWNQIENVNGEYVMLISDQIEILHEHWIEEMMMHAVRKNVFAVSPKIYNKDFTVNYAGICLDKDTDNYLYPLCSHDSNMDSGYEGMLCHVRNVTATTRECMLFERQKWIELARTRKLISGYEEVDMCLRALALNMRNVFVPYAECKLKKNSVIKQDSNEFKSKYYNEIENDIRLNENWKSLKVA